MAAAGARAAATTAARMVRRVRGIKLSVCNGREYGPYRRIARISSAGDELARARGLQDRGELGGGRRPREANPGVAGGAPPPGGAAPGRPPGPRPGRGGAPPAPRGP